VKIAEVTMKDLEYCINSADKAMADLDDDSNLKEVLWVKCYQIALHASEKYL